MFDNHNMAFYNHSSILSEIKSTDERMLTVVPFRPSYDETVLDNVYEKRTIEVKNVTGIVYIDAVATGYIKRYL